MNDTLKKLIKFCNEHTNIYLYGAGKIGSAYYHILKEQGIRIKGVVTTYGGEELEGIKCQKAEDVIWNDDPHIGIILSVKEQLQTEIQKQYSFKCDVFALSQLEFGELCASFYQKILSEINKNNPLCKTLSEDRFISLNIKNILVVQLEATFGDMLWSTAFLRELRRNYVTSKITLVVNSKFFSIYANCKYIDHIISYNCIHLLDMLSNDMVEYTRDEGKEIFTNQYDIVFLPRHLPLTISDAWENVIIAMLSSAKYRVAHGIGISTAEQLRCNVIGDFFSKVVIHTCGMHEVKYELEMIKSIGGVINDERMEIWLSNDDYKKARLQMQDERKCYISVALVGSEEKRSLDPQKYNNVFKRILKKYNDMVRFILCGGADCIAAGEIAKKDIDNACIDLIDKTTLLEAAAAIDLSTFFLGSDTGLMHFASALGKPVIEVSASIQNAPDYWGCSPVRTGPWYVPNIVLRPSTGLNGCKYMCAMKFRHCIEQISEKQLEEAICEMIDSFYLCNNYTG